MAYVEFTEDMKRDYTILVPNMLPMHFEMIVQVMRNYGYKIELLNIVITTPAIPPCWS